MEFATDVAREALWIAVKISLPVLAVGLAVGLVVAILQAATQVQESSLTFLPKMLAIVLTLALLMPWMLSVLVEYARRLISGFPGMTM
ncbi:MAG TPA: flagellar biosynthesis protein FliQ [Planctomycetota bacterium]|nr:flagellar biosynthesis protein FliQ [Planctomycetota bacterium]